MVAAFIGGILLSLSGYIFLRQATAYSQLKKLAATQASMKKVLHVMTRDIASAGGWVGNARRDFLATPGRIRFAYFDVRGRYCGSPDTVVMSFFMENGRGRANLTQEYRCERGSLQRRVLAAGANGDLNLSFQYLDSTGAVVSQPARVKAVRVSIAKRSEQAGRMPAALRAQTIQVEMVNL
jgi:hypothetical protein